jgi:hypothetical protein
MSFSLKTPVPEHVLVIYGKFTEISERNLFWQISDSHPFHNKADLLQSI